MADAFRTIRYARALRERHSDAPPNIIQIALVLATYADGRYGTSIRPGEQRLSEVTGRNRSTIRKALRWLETHGEIRCDKPGSRGSAACFTYLLPSPDREIVDSPASLVDPLDPPLTRPRTSEVDELGTSELELENQVNPGQPEGASAKTKRMYKLDADGKPTGEFEDVVM